MIGSERNRAPGRPGMGRVSSHSEGLAPGKQTLVEVAATAPLPPALRARLEHSLATDLSKVRVGVDPRVAAIGARAIASGLDVLFAPGAYQPDSPRGEELIAHEVAHLAQQAERRVAPTRVVAGLPINDDAGLEREADEVAARAVRGEVARSAGPAPGPGAAGQAPVQGFFDNLGKLGEWAGELIDGASEKIAEVTRRAGKDDAGAATSDPGAGSLELQRILERGALSTVEAARDALLAAQRRREPMAVLDQVSFLTDEGDYTLEVTPRVTDAMIPALEARREELAGEAEEDPVWGPFAEEFNQEFAGILHVFGLDKRDDGKKDPVMAARLSFLFTDEQRELLASYCDTHVIPDRLFDGDDPGRATAQQRIVLSSQILADGKYRPGSYAQEVHARACFHWAKIVYQYAGVAQERAIEGITDSFDVTGGVVLGSGNIREPFHGKRDPSLEPSAEHLAKNPNAYRFKNAPWDLVQDLRPGDWLYIYTENKTGSGAHSVIFAGWEGAEMVDRPTGLRYRKATTFDQGLVKSGGNRHHPILGEDFFYPAAGGTARPVNNIMRVDPDAAPADSVDDLRPALAKVAKKNRAFVTRLLRKPGNDGKTFDHDGFLGHLRAENTKLIEQVDAIEGRLTDGQKQLFRDANTSSNELDVICLNQRLFALAHNSDKLADKMEATYSDDLDGKNTEAMLAYVGDVVEIQGKLWSQAAEIVVLEQEADPLRDRLDEIDPAPEIKALRASRKQRRKELDKISTRNKDARKKKLAEIAAIDTQIAAARTEEKEHRKEIKDLHRALDKVEKAEGKASRKLEALVDELTELYPATEFGISHGANSSGQIKVKLDGRYESIPVDVTWQNFVVPAPPESE